MLIDIISVLMVKCIQRRNNMSIYKRIFKERDPARFERARQSGELDSTPNIIVPDFIEYYFKQYKKSLKYITNEVVENKIVNDTSKIIVWNNNYYSLRHSIDLHYTILAYLVIYKGLKIKSLQFRLHWSDYDTNEFLSLELNDGTLYLAESYQRPYQVSALVQKNKNNWKTTIDKICKQYHLVYSDVSVRSFK